MYESSQNGVAAIKSKCAIVRKCDVSSSYQRDLPPGQSLRPDAVSLTQKGQMSICRRTSTTEKWHKILQSTDPSDLNSDFLGSDWSLVAWFLCTAGSHLEAAPTTIRRAVLKVSCVKDYGQSIISL